MPKKEQTNVSQGTSRSSQHEQLEKEFKKDSKMKMKPPPSALSSAVSTISTITLTENDKPRDDDYEESDEVHKHNTAC